MSSTRQLNILDSRAGYYQPSKKSRAQRGRDSNRSRGGRGRGGATSTRSAVQVSRDNEIAKAKMVAKSLFAKEGLARKEISESWIINSIYPDRRLAQLSCAQVAPQLDGTIFDYAQRKVVARHLGSIPITVLEKIDIESIVEQGFVTFDQVSYPVDIVDGQPQMFFEPGYEGLSCCAYKHNGEIMVGNRTRISIDGGHYGDSRDYRQMLEQTNIDLEDWFVDQPDSTVFYFMLVASDLLAGSRQYVPAEEQYIVYLGSRDMENLSAPLNSDNTRIFSNGKSRVPARINSSKVYPIQILDIKAANNFLINGYSGQQRIDSSGWLTRRSDVSSEPYYKLFPSKFIGQLQAENLSSVARTLAYTEYTEETKEEIEVFIKLIEQLQPFSNNDQGVTEEFLEIILDDIKLMPDWENMTESAFSNQMLNLLYKLVASVMMADMDFLLSLPSVEDTPAELRNSESVVAYIKHTKRGEISYSLVHIYSPGMHYRRQLFAKEQNRLFSTYVSIYEQLALGTAQFNLPQFNIDISRMTPTSRFDIFAAVPSDQQLDETLLAKIILQDSLPEGRQEEINGNIECFEDSVYDSITRFIVNEAQGEPHPKQEKIRKFHGDEARQLHQIAVLTEAYRRGGMRTLKKKYEEVAAIDMFDLYRYINSMYRYISELCMRK